MNDAKAMEFSDASKTIEELTGIPDIDLFPGLRKWKAVKTAEKIADSVPADLRAMVARKLIGSILSRLLRRNG